MHEQEQRRSASRDLIEPTEHRQPCPCLVLILHESIPIQRVDHDDLGLPPSDGSLKLLGRIRLPEVCANLAFGGPKRNRLFMAASQSIYALYVATQGAGPG